MQYKNNSVLEQSLYADLYQRYAPVLLAYAHKQAASREDAEDIVVEVFLSVLQNPRFPAFDEKKQEVWLWTLTRNKLIDRYRRSLKRSHTPIEWLSETLYEDEREDPEQISLKREEYAQLYRAVRELPELQQEVLRLRFGHGLKFSEMSPVLEKSEPAIRMVLARALQRLRRLYKDQGKAVDDERT